MSPSQQISCITSPNLLASSMRITKLTLMIDNSTLHLPYPFTYQPDPIITQIEPAESFASGGRLILIVGRHLASPQSTKLMVYHEHRHNIVNATSCNTVNDTLVICLTPAITREMLQLSAANDGNVGDYGSGQLDTSSNSIQQQQQTIAAPNLSYESGGLKLKMSFYMDDVRSVRNLDEYYHHLPHYMTYFEDPQLFRLTPSIVEYSQELVLAGENLRMRNLDQDMLILIGSDTCALKSISANQIVCLPPQKVKLVYDELGRPIERPLLSIVALVGANLRFHLGHMQYSSFPYNMTATTTSLSSSSSSATTTSSNPTMSTTHQDPFSSSFSSLYPFIGYISQYPAISTSQSSQQFSSSTSTSSVGTSPSVAILITLSIIGFIIGFALTFMFAVSRFRQSKAEREYKRIQLQMGSLDITGQPMNGSLFDNIHHINNGGGGVRSRALDYVGGALSGKKLFYHFNQPHLPASSFPPSPLTDISSLAGSNPMSNGLNQHVVKLSSNGTIINSTANHLASQHQQYHQQHHYQSANNGGSSQSSPGSSTRTTSGAGGNHMRNGVTSAFGMAQQQPQLLQNFDKNQFNQPSTILSSGLQANGNSRNFNWTQEAPSTIVPYAVIEACNLSLEGKGATKDYL